MHKVIPHHLHDRVFVYLDDLLVTSATFDEHLELLRDVAVRLKNANLLKYLGYVVGSDGLKIDENKVKAILNFRTPSNVKHVRSFLGITGW